MTYQMNKKHRKLLIPEHDLREKGIRGELQFISDGQRVKAIPHFYGGRKFYAIPQCNSVNVRTKGGMYRLEFFCIDREQLASDFIVERISK